MHDFNLFILNYLAAYANRAQWQGDGCEVCRRIAKDRNWQSWSHVEGVGSAQQGVHRDEVRRIQLQRPGDHRRLGLDHHQRTLWQEDSLLGHEKLGVARERDRAAGKSHLAWFIERFVSRRVIHWFIQPANLTSFSQIAITSRLASATTQLRSSICASTKSSPHSATIIIKSPVTSRGSPWTWTAVTWQQARPMDRFLFGTSTAAWSRFWRITRKFLF